jgi:uncharacterized protein (DUF2141 family)
MRQVGILGAVVAAALTVSSLGQGMVSATAQGADVEATVTYTGKGKVDDTHEIWVFLFDTPDIDANSRPIAVQSITKSGGTATFTGISAKRVYMAVAYDEKGDYDGEGPPFGLPTAMYSKDRKTNEPITPRSNEKVTLTFDDSYRLQPPK